MTTLFPILCVICNVPIEVDAIKYVDEDGKPVHEPCYVQVTKKQPASLKRLQSKFDSFA